MENPKGGEQYPDVIFTQNEAITMKKILLFFPENPLKQDSGNKTRVVELLKYYKDRGILVDFVSMQDRDFQPEDLEKLKETGWVSNAYLIKRKPKKGNFFSYLFESKIPSALYNRSKVLNFVTYNLKKEFDAILRQNQYDFIIISYVGWANLLDDKSPLKGARTIIDTHDFATVQAKNQKRFELGLYFNDEISKLNRFDEVWAISGDEFFVFNQFVNSKVTVRFVPFVLPNHFNSLQSDKIFDLLYVASDNSHNSQSAKWFFDQVYPLLDSSIKIHVVGKIGNTIGAYPNVEKSLYLPNLDDAYAQSKVVLCPMFSGSGLKIKVIEALSFGLPVVTTTRGIDGLSNKTNNGCVVENEPARFALAIQKLLTDVQYYQTVCSEAKTFYSNHYDAAVIYRKWDEIYSLE